MTTFREVLDWDTSEAFYKDIDIEICGLHNDTYDGSLGHSYIYFKPVTSVDNVPIEKYDYKTYKWHGPNCNGHTGHYYGHSGENYMFLDTSTQDLYSVSELESSDEDCGWSMSVTARTGYMVHLNIHADNKTADFLNIPVKYHMIEYTSRSWGEGGTNGRSHQIPYFETFPIGEEEDISILMKGLKKMYWKHEFFFTNSIQEIMKVPKPLTRFFLCKNKKLWWAANKIASQWSKTYWSPETKIGKKRLQRRFEEN